MIALLASLNDMLLETLQCNRLSRSCCRPTDEELPKEDARHLVSSANRKVLEKVTHSGRSLI